MISTAKAVAAVLAVAAGVAAFLATPAPGRQDGRGRQAALSRWLDLSAERAEDVRKADPDFQQESGLLTANLAAEREKLAALIEDPASSDKQVLEHVERVIAAHDALERRVARHVLAIRPHLTADQQKRLMGLCASGVREAGRPWRRGRGQGGGQGLGQGGGQGLGQGGGQGKGPGGPWRDDDRRGGGQGQGRGGRGSGRGKGRE